MSEKMPEKTRAILVNVCIAGALVFLYFMRGALPLFRFEIFLPVIEAKAR